MNYVGKNSPIHDARGKVQGRTRYAADYALPGMAHLALVFSTVPHGWVKSVDASAALALEGVYGVFHCLNTPDYRYNRYRTMHDQVLPAEEGVFNRRVRFVGDRVGVVAAKDEATARRAAALVKVEYETLPAALTFEEALEGKNCLEGETPLKDEFTMTAGELTEDTEGLLEVTAETEIGRIAHAAMEPHACVADYDPTLDEMTIRSPNQSVFAIRTVVADMLGMPYSRIRVVKTTMGGSFGGKQEWVLEPVCAVAARALGRPVKLVFDRREVMRSTYCRAPMRGMMKGWFKPDGTIVKLHLDILADTGAYVGNSCDYMRALFGKLFRCYSVPGASIHSRLVSTNTPVSGSYRSWTGQEGALMMEHLMENAALALHMDPVELRLKNALTPADCDRKSGLPMEEIRVKECLELGAEKFGWADRRAADAAFNAANGRFRRGTAVGCGGHGNTYFPRHNDFAGVEVRMCEDGTVQANVTIHDHGCGTVTAFRQILAETLEVAPETIRMDEGDTARSPYDFGCYASRSTFVVGRTVQQCGENLRAELKRIAAQMLEAPEEELYFDGPVVRRTGCEETALTYKDICWWAIHNLRREIFVEARHHNNTNPGVVGVHFAHVEVDTWTGLTRVLDYLALQDIGQAINPAMCVAQIQGAVQMGCGVALREEVSILPDGRCVDSLAKYHLMNAPDLPEIKVELVQDGTSQEGPFGAKSIGEVCFVPTAPAVAAAVNQALGSDLSVLPMSPDRIVEYVSAKEEC